MKYLRHVSLIDTFIARVSRRECDLLIGGKENPYLRRWYVIPRNPVFNIYLHNIRRSDDDRALHDHPWFSFSICLRGEYFEVVPGAGYQRRQGCVVWRGAKARHRLVVGIGGKPVWTLFITGPKLREWGFWCPQGWVRWKDYTAGAQGETIGRGCGEP